MALSAEHKAILKAAKSGESETVRKMLAEHPYLVSARDADGSTPLHCAAWKSHVTVVEVLLNAGADIQDRNQNDHWGVTALHAAAHGNQKAVVELLLARGADPKALNPAGRTPLQETEFHNASAAAKLLKAALGS